MDLLEDDVAGGRNSAIPPYLQILGVIRFLSEGSFQKGAASDFNHPMSQASISRCIEKVINAIIRVGNRFITFPNDPQERQRVSNRYVELLI